MMYTANQPLFLGGQIYMWNRYKTSKRLIHMVEAQFTKFGHQSRIQLLNSRAEPQWIIAPLESRNFKPINDVYLSDPVRTFENLEKTLNSLYPKSLGEPEFIEGLLDTFNSKKFRSLSRINCAVTDYIWEYLFGGDPEYKTYVSTDIIPVRDPDPSVWVAQLGNAIDCKIYLGGQIAKDAYLLPEDFYERGMDFVVQDYTMQSYSISSKNTSRGVQEWGSGNSYISIIDPLMRLGKEKTLELLK